MNSSSTNRRRESRCGRRGRRAGAIVPSAPIGYDRERRSVDRAEQLDVEGRSPLPSFVAHVGGRRIGQRDVRNRYRSRARLLARAARRPSRSTGGAARRGRARPSPRRSTWDRRCRPSSRRRAPRRARTRRDRGRPCRRGRHRSAARRSEEEDHRQDVAAHRVDRMHAGREGRDGARLARWCRSPRSRGVESCGRAERRR